MTLSSPIFYHFLPQIRHFHPQARLLFKYKTFSTPNIIFSPNLGLSSPVRHFSPKHMSSSPPNTAFSPTKRRRHFLPQNTTSLHKTPAFSPRIQSFSPKYDKKKKKKNPPQIPRLPPKRPPAASPPPAEVPPAAPKSSSPSRTRCPRPLTPLPAWILTVDSHTCPLRGMYHDTAYRHRCAGPEQPQSCWAGRPPRPAVPGLCVNEV